MRKTAIVCLILAIVAGSSSFAVGSGPAQPAGVLPMSAGVLPPTIAQIDYVYDAGEDLDEKYVPAEKQADDDVDSNAALNETREMEQANDPAPEHDAVGETREDEVSPDSISSDSISGVCSNGGCNSCDCCREESWCDCAGDFTLDGALGWECCPYNIGGWTEMGYTSNNVPLSQAYDDLLSFGDVPDNVNLNQQWMFLEKTVDGTCGWDLGGRVDAVYGTDAQKTQSFGNPEGGIRNRGFFDASWDHGIYGFAMPQLYGEVAYHDLAVKVGHFFTPMGYEVIPATGNFFYTHSYTMFNSEPFTHTGALATYTATKASRCTAVGRSAGTPASISSTAAAIFSAAFPPSSTIR